MHTRFYVGIYNLENTKEKTQYLSSEIGLIHLKPLHWHPFLYIWHNFIVFISENNSIVYVKHSFLIYSSAEHLGWFSDLPAGNSAA